VDDRDRRPDTGTPTTPVPPPPQQGGYYPPPGYGYGYPPPYPYAPPPRKGLPRWFWWVVGIIGLVVVLAGIGIVMLGLWFGDTLSRPLQTVTRFYSALDAGRCDEARDQLSGSIASTDWCARWRQLKERGATEPGGLNGGISVRNGIATIDWVLQAGGTRHETEVQLEERGGQWKIVRSFPDLLPER
jgi:CubicO group peptidase (beta-lactamase class C family)